MGRHRLPQTHRPYQIEQLWDIHHEVIRLSLIGMKPVDIANHLNITPQMVGYTLRSPLAIRQLDCLKAERDLDAIDVAKEIKNLAPKAVQVLEELLDDSLPNIKLAAAKDVLDRAGHAAVKVIKADVGHHFSADEIAEIRNNARSIGLMIDAEYEVTKEAVGV